MGAAAFLALRFPLAADQGKLPAQFAESVIDGTAVDLQLLFTFTF